ncbi:MAG: hypothetical protein C0462_03680 [Alcanivorax sp.]|nr:hypothetical protein [Alcanivorax sp.]
MKTHQSGIGIVEIMISLAVGALLIAGLTQVFTGSRAAYVLQEDLSRLQESGRFAFHFLSREGRMAGYFGCRRDVTLNSVINDSNAANAFLYNFNNGLQGYRREGNTWRPAAPAGLQALIPDALPDSDVIVIRSSGTDTVSIDPPLHLTSSGAANFRVQSGHPFVTGDILMLSDCAQATVFQTTSANANSVAIGTNSGGNTAPGNSSRVLGIFSDDAVVSRFTATVFYVAPGANRRPALFRRINNDPPEELVEGVERMRVLYGVSATDQGQVNRYEQAQDVNNWANVSSMRISLLLSGNRDNMTDEEQVLVFDGERFDAGNRRLHHVVTSTIALRNRIR